MSADDGGQVAPDGSPVAVYRRLPSGREPEIIHAATGAGTEILELGCGAGRVTRSLVGFGHRVTAVDESAEMLVGLRDLPGVEAVHSRIEDLDLGRTFRVVVLGSNLINMPREQLDPVLEASRKALASAGTLLVEAYPPEMDWPAAVSRDVQARRGYGDRHRGVDRRQNADRRGPL